MCPYRSPEGVRDANNTYTAGLTLSPVCVTNGRQGNLQWKISNETLCKISQGSQTKSYNNTLKASFKNFNIDKESWKQLANGRSKWPCIIRKCADE